MTANTCLATHGSGETMCSDLGRGSGGANRDGPLSKICFITRKWPPAMGGMETYCWELTRHLHKYTSLDIIALPGRRNGKAPSIPAMLGFGLITVLRLIVGRRARVFHVGDLAMWPVAWVAALRHRSARVILSVHGSDVSYAHRDGFRPWLYGVYLGLGARLLRRAQFVANSDWIAGLMKVRGFSDIHVVALATKLSASHPPRENNGQLFFAGRLIRSKGLSFIVERVLPLLDPSVGIRVAGACTCKIEAHILDAARVTYLGVLPPEALVEEYGRSLCTLVPSLRPEGFGLVAAEAAACGSMVIASNHSGLAEVVMPEMGFLAEAGNACEWAERIETIRAWDEIERTRRRTASLQAAQRRYNWDRVARETLAIYDGRATERQPMPTNKRSASV